ncbi:response regulator transcription factor [Sphaerimonospora cavernae]|uniref:Response regulator transcription factor n=1 Tax=Sphaerimonospora cavernae TaxID=1740611 RepID=A0ABV6TYX7_9ACTN
MEANDGPSVDTPLDVLVTDRPLSQWNITHTPHDVGYVLLLSPDGRLSGESTAGVDGCVSDMLSAQRIVEAIMNAAQTRRPAAARPHLSQRELQVLISIADGLTHAQIARRLGISPHTVDTYVKRIRSKVGGGNKAHLVKVSFAMA